MKKIMVRVSFGHDVNSCKKAILAGEDTPQDIKHLKLKMARTWQELPYAVAYAPRTRRHMPISAQKAEKYI
eukprot:scaffold2950_cov93-Skeletonema_menzelii.AAC.5